MAVNGNHLPVVCHPWDQSAHHCRLGISKIVILSTTKALAKDDRKDTPIPIIITAYAVDEKEKIVITRDTIFVYPRESVLNDHR